MHQSRIIEIDGVFLGAAVMVPGDKGWRIVAADSRLSRCDGFVAESFPEIRRLARQAYLATRFVPVFGGVPGNGGPGNEGGPGASCEARSRVSPLDQAGV